MRLSLIRQLWGIEKPWDPVFKRIKAAGFDGVEIALSLLDPVKDYCQMIGAHELSLVPMIFTTGDTVDDHIQSFREQVKQALRFDPTKINCHDGRDAWSDDESTRYFQEVLAIERDVDVPVAHETHRGRVLYNPWTTARLLDQFEHLRLCCDFSHWVCVCERLIDDQQSILETCAARAEHVHGRVGHQEGPQVSDPRDAAYARELAAHERWWDLVWDRQEAAGETVSTFTPEFGPPPYMPVLPYSHAPVADLWTVSNWVADRQRQRFSQRPTSA